MYAIHSSMAVIALAAALAVPARPVWVEGPARDLQGTWAAITGESGGHSLDPGAVKRFKVTFRGDAVFLDSGVNPDAEARFTVDPTVSPHTIDFIYHLETPPRTVPGVFAIRGDTLTLATAYTGGGAARPTNLNTAPEGVVLYQFRRLKN